MPSNSINIREPESDNPSPLEGLIKATSNSLREEAAELFMGCMAGVHDGVSDNKTAYEYADQILNLVASKMPEKKTHNLGTYSLDELGKLEQDAFEKIMYDEGFQDAITEVISILKGGTDE